MRRPSLTFSSVKNSTDIARILPGGGYRDPDLLRRRPFHLEITRCDDDTLGEIY